MSVNPLVSTKPFYKHLPTDNRDCVVTQKGPKSAESWLYLDSQTLENHTLGHSHISVLPKYQVYIA